MAEKDAAFGTAREVSNKRTIDLDDIDRQNLKMPQRGVAGAKIIESDAAACMAQGVDETRRFVDIVKRRGFGDLYDEAMREIGPVSQQRNQRPQPRSIG